MTAPADVEQVTDLPVIEFVSPMPGFPEHRRFVLVRVDDEGLLYALTSIHDPDLRFLVVPPVVFFPDYSPQIPEESTEQLGVTDPARVLPLLVVTTGESVADATANLLAPILVDESTRKALQVILAGSGLPVRAPLMPAAA